MKKYLPFALATLVMFLVPLSSVDAQAGGFVPCDGPTCSACDLVSMINRIIVWLFGFVFVVFAVLMVVAGFGLVTSGGNQSALDAAKSKFQNALIGIIIMMAAWLIVDTLLRAILAGGTGQILNYGPWSEVRCFVQEVPQEFVESSPEPADSVPTEPSVPGETGTRLSQSEAEARLRAAGISIKPGAGLEGIRSGTIDGVIALRNSCGCNITVTEGTGGTHSNGTYSHANGYKLDLRTRDNPTLVNYIRNTYQPAGTWSDGTPLYRNGNATYAMESDHIDVVYR